MPWAILIQGLKLPGGLPCRKSLVSPISYLDFRPTGGITIDNLADYPASQNVFYQGGSRIASSDDIRAGNWQGISDKAKLARRRVENE